MKTRLLKTVIFSALSTVMAFTAVTYSSCSGDKCKAIVCANGGTCNDGVCKCVSGYEGVQCEVTTRDKYVGVYQVTETSTLSATTREQYAITLNNDSSMTSLRIKNFYNAFIKDVRASIVGDSIFIPKQTYEGKTVRGYGNLVRESATYSQHAQIIMHYSVTYEDGRVDDFGIDNGSPSVWQR